MADKITTEILARIKDWEKYAQPYLQEVVANEERYDGIVERKREGMGWANTNDLEFYNIVESVKSATMSVLMSDDPPFVFKAQTVREQQEREAAASQALVERDWVEGNGESELNEIAHDWVLHGSTAAHSGWNFQERWKTIPGVFEEGRRNDELIKRVTYRDHAILKPLSLWHFAFEPGPFNDVQEAEWVAEERLMSRRQVENFITWAKSMPGAKVKTLKGMADMPQEAPTTIASQYEEQITSHLDVGDTPSREFRCRFYYGDHPEDPNKPGRWLVFLVNDHDWGAILPNPWHHGLIPYCWATLGRKKGHPYGRGVGQLLMTPHEQLNEVNNLATDLSNMALMGVMISDSVVPLEGKANPIKPGAILTRAELGGKVEWLHPRLEGIGAALGLQDRLRSTMRVAAGAVAQQQALPSGSELATEIKLLASEAARRTVGRARILANNVLRPHLFMAHENIRQFQSREVLARYDGADEAFGPGDILPDPDIQLKLAADLENRPAMVQRLGRAITAMSQLADKFPKIQRYLEPTLERLLSLAGVDLRNLPDPEPIAAPALPGGIPTPAGQDVGPQPLPEPVSAPPALPQLGPEEARQIMAREAQRRG